MLIIFKKTEFYAKVMSFDYDFSKNVYLKQCIEPFYLKKQFHKSSIYGHSQKREL